MNKEWFEMEDLKKHSFNNKVWIPLYGNKKILESGEFGFENFTEEYLKVRSFVAPQKKREIALKSRMIDLGYEDKQVKGYSLVLEQFFEIERKHEVHIHQDIVLALELKREGDIWVCPEEDYVEVIKLERDAEEEPIYVEIRAEFLKDFLSAEKSGLILKSYQSRKSMKENFNDLNWKENDYIEQNEKYKWEGRLQEKSEGNSLLDVLGGAMVSHAGRTDTDYSEDIPIYEFPTGENTWSKTWSVKSSGRKLFQASGEIWKTEWIEPALKSPRVRGDKVQSKLEFIIDNEGKTETSETLLSPSRWLWFHPNVINDLLKKRTGILTWHSEDTGSIGGAWNRSVHFGVNSIGLINVYAEDIANVDEIDKKVWARHNVSPEGRVSEELLSSQMQAIPAKTDAPEQDFFLVVQEIQKISKSKLGQEFFREHSFEEGINKRIHRFQATSLEGFFLLCKEITRYLIERIDMDFLKTLKKEKDNLGTLKRLENILTALGYDGRKIMGVLVGVYDLRLTDAHLPSKEKTEDAMKLIGIDYDEMGFNSGKELIKQVNNSLIEIGRAIYNGDFTKLQ